MKITFLTGCTSTKVGDKKPTRFYGGETEDIVDAEAKYLIEQGFAGRPNDRDTKAVAAAIQADINPRTRRQDLEAETPGLRARLAIKGLGMDGLPLEGRKVGPRSKTALLGTELNGPVVADADA